MATAKKKSNYKTREELAKELRDLRKELKELREAKEAIAQTEVVAESAPKAPEQKVVVQQPKGTIDWTNRMVELVQIMKGETPLYFGSGENKIEVGQFAGANETLTISFPELQRVVNTSPFSKYFKELGILILDDEVIKKLNYDRYYKKHDVGRDSVDKLFDLEPEGFKKKFESMPDTLKSAVIYHCVQGINSGDARCTRMEIQNVINQVCKFNKGYEIYDLAQKMKSK